MSSNSQFELYSPKALYHCFQKKEHGHVFLHYAGADWLGSSVNQRVMRGQLPRTHNIHF